MVLGLTISLLGALLGPSPFRAPHRSAVCCVSSSAAGTGEELATASVAGPQRSKAERLAPAVVKAPTVATGAAARNTTHGRLLACALRLQAIDPSEPCSISAALVGAPLAAHNLTSLLLMLKRCEGRH